MIDILFRDCCQECNNIDVDYDVTETGNCLGEKKAYVTVGCFHSEVCKKYIESVLKTEVKPIRSHFNDGKE